MTELRFTQSHEWISAKSGIATVGITQFAVQQLGDVVYVELPEPGKKLTGGAEAAVVESVKAAGEIYAPVAGEVTGANRALAAEPAKGNGEPEGEAWFFRWRLWEKRSLPG